MVEDRVGNIRTMADLREAVEGAVQILLALFSIVLLALAPVYATRGQVDIASALAGFFLLSMLTLSLPRLRAIEAFGVKAKLRKEIKKAEITLDQLKRLARTSARQGFLQVHSLPMRERGTMIAALNDTVAAADLTDDEAAELRRPLMDAVARDILYIGQLAAVHLNGKAIHATEAALRLLQTRIVGAPDPNEAERNRLETEKTRLIELKIPDRRDPTTADTLSAHLDGCLADFPREPEDDRRLRAVLRSARAIMAECVKIRSITPDFEAISHFLPVHAGGYAGRNDGAQRAEGLLNSRFGEG